MAEEEGAGASATRADIRRMCDATAALRREAETVFAQSSAAQWSWSPRAATWSMASIVEHLNSVARHGLPAIESTLTEVRSKGLLSDALPKYGLFDRFFVRMLSPNPPFRVPVPPIYEPDAAGKPGVEIGAAFLAGLLRTERCVLSADGLDLKAVKMPSPADARIRVAVGAWLEGIVAHNQYHWLQVRDLRLRPDFPRE